VAVFVAQTKILDSDPPGTLLGWVAALFVVWGTLLTFASIGSAFASAIARREKFLSGLSGCALPVGWVLWGIALLHAKPTAVRIAIVSGGVAVILAAGLVLRAFFRDGGSAK
jgi:hypothetical protein